MSVVDKPSQNALKYLKFRNHTVDSVSSKLPKKESDPVAQTLPKRRRGRFRGSTGQHAFYHAKARDWHVDPEIVRTMCKQTNFTQCEPPTKRSEEKKKADRASRKPFKVVTYIRFRYNPNDPSFAGCDYDNCVYTGNVVTADTDAVFIFGVGLKESTPLPKLRLPHQTYIIASWEPPAFIWSDTLTNEHSKWNHFFNATMTYRIDADISYRYGKLDFQPRRQSELPNYRMIARLKTRTAIWMVSNCGPTPSKRMAYVKEMQKYIDIDIFGVCGEPCELNDERCVADFSSTYKFYLAFENSFSTDYVTEKLFKLFVDDMHIIPVVRGAVDYNREFPEKSLVNSANFKNPQELALFLKALGADEMEYSNYLEVKDRYRAITFGNRWCYLCEYLHKEALLNKNHIGNRTVNIKKTLFKGHVFNPS
ncbi:alpha-(1,3)-fucosyltransferase c-like [Plakobranchus ocellatus]|uniref:Fucosyltransferase n=1 Tax=Plakobranchus ocellatus TaxID=259542 RepID=A0AAV4AIQ3_9GAST|nr:alpha-(1,3)-fucosyltransferase c-like [Plakobranchus ocellatus]